MSEVFAAHGVTIKKSSYDHLERIGRHLEVTLSCRLCRPKRCGLPGPVNRQDRFTTGPYVGGLS